MARNERLRHELTRGYGMQWWILWYEMVEIVVFTIQYGTNEWCSSLLDTIVEEIHEVMFFL